ncbi:uncharacterized protein LOC129583560 [Paramacrobiotus metropolitanus]|uniref:uncharacterized protein LOC129583560 n=1 Tax=Paramacrobiotus metropolitanus TaxID=2943436 RepID=UPI00244570A5|nr:uncharacterized protein LOC129583560 [Paramacrobiotus metropolitanus]
MIRISSLSSVLKLPNTSSPRPVIVGCTRYISGGYNEDATEQGSVVSGPNPKERYSPAHAVGRAYRKSIPGIGEVIDYEKDEYAYFKVRPPAAEPVLRPKRDVERLHTESFAFQEWGEARDEVMRDYKTRTGILAHKWDVSDEEMNYTWRANPGGREPAFRQPYSPPEEFNPKPLPPSDPYVVRVPYPLHRRAEMKPLQRGTTWRLDPMPLVQKYASWADYADDYDSSLDAGEKKDMEPSKEETQLQRAK